MTWQQLTCQTTPEFQQILSDVLENAGAAAVTLQDAADQPLLEPLPGETPLWDQLTVTGLYPADTDLTHLLLLLESQRTHWQIQAINLEKLADQPWVRAWMDNFHPMQFGQLWVYPSWKEPPASARKKLLLDPGLAFGTGTHPTTALCLDWLGHADLHGKNLLDYGCGSGILALAALKLGMHHVVATDIDPQAIEATRDNAQRNHIKDEQLHTCLPDKCPNQRFDVVIANILAGPLSQLNKTLLDHLKPGGYLVLSGILASQADELMRVYQPDLQDINVQQQEEWIRLTGRAKA